MEKIFVLTDNLRFLFFMNWLSFFSQQNRPKKIESFINPSYDVFISYAKENEAIVRRFYDDLSHSGLKVWDFQKRGEIGVNFEEEFKQQIAASRYFCLIDSSYARQSKYVEIECLYAINVKKQHSFPQIVICKVEKGQEWQKKEIFPGQNLIRSINFVNYEEGIKTLYDFFKILYVPRFTSPRDKDFIEEMSQLNMHRHKKPIATRDWQHLMDNYKKFRHQYETNQQYAEVLISEIIHFSKGIGIKLKTPYLALGVLQADVKKDHEALKTFQEASEIFSNDPRFFAGLGGAYYHCTNYKKAVESYVRCIDLINNSENITHKSHLVEVVYNLEEALRALGEYDYAYNKIQEFPALYEYPEIQIIVGKILLHMNKAREARKYFERAYDSYRYRQDLTIEEEKLFSSLILILAECYKTLNLIKEEKRILFFGSKRFAEEAEIWRRYALFCWETEGIKAKNDVIKNFEMAISVSNGHIKYRSELALIFNRIGDKKGCEQQLKECFKLEENITTSIEKYYLGLAYFIDNKHEMAKIFFSSSKLDKQIADWCYYDKLMTNR